MATIMRFDEIEKLKSMPFSKYFGEMDLTEEQIEERTELAEKLNDAFLLLFILALMYNEQSMLTFELLYNNISDKVESLMLEIGYPENEIQAYINDSIVDIVDTTIKNIENGYYTSEDRARFIAENEANTIYNSLEFYKATESGKKLKTWITMRDGKVRHNHRMVDNMTIKIEKPFTVGDSLMMFPKDDSLNADDSEIVNCRCTIQYK